MSSDSAATCLVYLPFTYAGSGVPETAASLLRGIDQAGLDVRVFVPRVRRPLPDVATTKQTLPLPLRYLRWRHIWQPALGSLDRAFRRAVEDCAGGPAVAYMWPSYYGAPPVEVIRHAQDHGVRTARQMVNTATATSQAILDDLHERHGHDGPHNITDGLVAHEATELPAHDFIFAPADGVEQSLLNMGIAASHIIPTSFGWKRSRFPGTDATEPVGAAADAWDGRAGLRVLFVGIVGLRKGVPELLEAWESAGIDGQLLLVGGLDEGIRDKVDAAIENGNVRHLSFTDDVGSLYRSADIFVFPSHEEGGPQVTYEAAAHGIAILATGMGAGRVVQNERSGLVVPEGDVAALRAGLQRLSASAELRQMLGTAAAEAAREYEYSVVGRVHGELLRTIANGDTPTTLAG